MSGSMAVVKTLGSVHLIFGLDWFAILGGTVSREVRRIARQQKATHVVHSSEDAVSVGVIALPAAKRSAHPYSAAQLVAERFPTGVVGLVVQLDPTRWWLVAVHEGAVIARTDTICASFDAALERIELLRQAYPGLTLLNDVEQQPSLSDIAGKAHAGAQLRRVAHANRFTSRPFYGVSLLVCVFYALYQIGLLGDGAAWRDPPSGVDDSAEQAWKRAHDQLSRAHWVHGVAGSAELLLSLYALPVQLAGWRLRQADCIASRDHWNCHADYGRDDPETNNERFLEAAQQQWDVSFTPLDQARIRWSFASTGRELGQSSSGSREHIERALFSALQAIRPAFAQMTIDDPQPLRVPVPHDQNGHAYAEPAELPRYGVRSVRVQAPLRSVSLLLPHAASMAWRRASLSFDPRTRSDLLHSPLSLDLQGVLYEKD